MKKIFLSLLALIICSNVFGQKITKDVLFAKTEEKELLLDLYIPDNSDTKPLIIWVHGGAWHSGSKEGPPLDLVRRGFPMASISYRRSIEAVFPAQIHDINAAVRFLRANATQFGYSAEKIILWGSSAGGHLVALAGMANGDKYLEGSVGDHLNISSDIQGTIDFYGPTNFNTILNQSTPHGLSVRAPALALLYGMPTDDAGDRGISGLASPVNYVDANDPPIFIAHGDQDYQVPINQSIELFGKCQQFGVESKIEFITNNGHGGEGFSQKEFIDMIVDFIGKISK